MKVYIRSQLSKKLSGKFLLLLHPGLEGLLLLAERLLGGLLLDLVLHHGKVLGLGLVLVGGGGVLAQLAFAPPKLLSALPTWKK